VTIIPIDVVAGMAIMILEVGDMRHGLKSEKKGRRAMAASRKFRVNGVDYRFTVLERLDGKGPAFEANRFSAVVIGTDDDGDEDREVISRHATLAEATAAVEAAKSEFLSERLRLW